MRRGFRGADDWERPRGGRSASEVGKSVRPRFPTRSGVGLLAVFVLAPLAITSETGSSAAWTISTGHPALVRAVAITADGRRIATAGNDGGAVLWEVGRGVERELPGDPTDAMHCLCFSPDGTLLATGSRDATIALWDVATGRKRASLQGHTLAALCVAFSPDGTRLATGSADESVRLWDAATGEAMSILRGHHYAVCKIGFAPDGRTLASGSAGGEVKLWDVSGPEGRERPGCLGHRACVQSLAFSPEGSTLASWGGGEGIKVWEVATGRERATFPTGDRITQALGFTADGHQLTGVSTFTGIVHQWEVASGREQIILRVPSGVCSAVFSPEGRRLVTGGDDAVARVWDLSPSAASRVP